jgi:hypothetical protein
MTFFTAAERAGFFADDLAAEAATFTPATGPAVSCTILVKRPDETSGAGLAGIATYNTQIEVDSSEVADPTGGSFSGATALGGLVYIVSDANRDELGEVWTCLCRPST